MPESQNIEYKSSWHDDYLKWICGFANAQGGLIDSWGRGTVRIIEACKEAGLPEPELTERDGGFLVTLYKDNLTGEQLVKLGLNARQIKAVQYVKEKGAISTSKYVEEFSVSERTARNDLSELVDRLILKRIGETNQAKYVMA